MWSDDYDNMCEMVYTDPDDCEQLPCSGVAVATIRINGAPTKVCYDCKIEIRR